jgi:hypothetical protein
MTPPKLDLTLTLDVEQHDRGCKCPECEPDQEVRDEDEADYRDRAREAWASRGW